MKRWKRWLLLAVALLAALALGAPFWRADSFAPRIQAGLERALQRRVRVGDVRFHLLTGPGFTVSDVEIGEDPAVSAEPFAYVTTMVVRLRLASLLGGRFEFSNLRLEEPSVNLMRTDRGGWNVQAFLRHSNAASGELPDIEVRNGRVNFKLAGVKSVYYFTNADIDFSAESGGEAFDLWFRGEPSRTDRTAQGFGRFTGRGRWLRRENAEPRLELDYQLERSAVEELAILLAGRDLGLHGMVESRGRLAGPVSAMELSGRLDLNDLHYWSQLPRPGQWRIGYKGTWNLPGESFSVSTESPADAPLPFGAALTVSQYLGTPRWKVDLEARDLPLALAVGWLRPQGEAFQDLQVEGTLAGQVAMRHDQPAAGRFEVRSFALLQSGQPLVKSEMFPVEIGDGLLRLDAPALAVGSGPPAPSVVALDASWNWAARSVDARLQSRSVELARLQTLARLFGENPPLLLDLDGGTLRGSVQMHRVETDPPEWSGSFALAGSRLRVPEVAEPVRLQQAQIDIAGGRLAARGLRAGAGKLSWHGEYRYEPAGTRPHRFDLTLDEASAADLERLLQPALRRERSFLSRTLGIGEDQVPDWLASRRAEGVLRISSLTLGGEVIENARAAVQWDASKVALRELRGHWRGAPITGSLAVNLQRAVPQYTFTGGARGVAWQEGSVDIEGTLEARGNGSELLSSLRARGEITGEEAQVAPDRLASRFKTRFAVTMAGAAPRVTLEGVEAEINREAWTGQGATQRDGRLQVDLTSEGRELRLSGTIQPLVLEAAPPPVPPATR